MNVISIKITDRLPKVEAVSATAVSDNRFRLEFTLDDAWDMSAVKTVWIVHEDGDYESHVITGNTLDVLMYAESYINIGVSQGTDLASRPCRISIQGSIKQLIDGTEREPSEDQWETIIDMINQLPGALEAAEKSAASAKEAATAKTAAETAESAAADAQKAAETAKTAAEAARQGAEAAAGNAAQSATNAAGSASAAATAKTAAETAQKATETAKSAAEAAAVRAESLAGALGGLSFSVGENGIVTVTKEA